MELHEQKQNNIVNQPQIDKADNSDLNVLSTVNADIVQHWWLTIDIGTWDIAKASIGDKKTISFLPPKLEKDEDFGLLKWLYSYFVDREDNPHYGQPIPPDEMAISLLDFEGDVVNKENIEKAKRRISKNRKKYLGRMGIIMDPEIVLDKPSYKKRGGRQTCAWLTVLDANGKPLEKTVKNQYRHVVSTDERVPRELSQHVFVHYFYRLNSIPQKPFTEGKEYEEEYVQAASKTDPEIDYPKIKEIDPFSHLHVGDKVFACTSLALEKKIVAFLEITSVRAWSIDLKILDFFCNPCPISALKSEQSNFYNANNSGIIRLTNKQNKEITRGIETWIERKIKKSLKTYSMEELMNDKDVFIDEETLRDIFSVIKDKKNIILQGAPGVGKTYLAKKIAYALVGKKDDSKICTIQFHPNYTYEDFIIGYKPVPGNDSSRKSREIEFKPVDGIFKEFCDKASSDLKKNKDESNKYFFIIDEINRGNISKIFGEAFTLIDKGYRDESVKLSYPKKVLNIPKNLYLIGLMNTADRSLAMLDFALQRRFAFFSLSPAFETESFKAYKDNLKSDIFNTVIDKIIKLNTIISQDPALGEGFCIGHSYFCNQERIDEVWLKNVINYEIIPMLRGYWFDNDSRFKEYKKELLDVFL
ncbi:AAA family ATPase [Prevotella sp. E13-27]|uniref:AAA family ATPase n=1 Tax=Prevotella sp. E13-27 TaxID=2938122 RepID=UPI00200A7404|nr:AAA family ATPase [Prevotella sp. E13-27]MCK8622543.1 AAA family ATPase [Prevotella sp. E13-27]